MTSIISIVKELKSGHFESSECLKLQVLIGEYKIHKKVIDIICIMLSDARYLTMKSDQLIAEDLDSFTINGNWKTN